MREGEICDSCDKYQPVLWTELLIQSACGIFNTGYKLMLHVLDCLFTLATYDTTIPDIKLTDVANFSGIITFKTRKGKIVNKL